MFKKLKNKLKLYLFRRKFRKKNQHNLVIAENIFPIDIVKIGNMSYGQILVESWGSKNENLVIGNYVSMGANVKFMLGGNHNYKSISTYPFKNKILNENIIEAYSKGSIIVEDDVWIGSDVTILSGVRIGQGSIIGTRSLVSKNVSPYSIVAGNPARVVKFRFDQDIVEELKKIDFKNMSKEFIKDNMENFYENINYNIIKDVVEKQY